MACDECGWSGAADRAECRALFDSYLARDFSDASYFRTHRTFVDTYCLQHPEQFCKSAKSFTAHLVGLSWTLEGRGGTAVGPESLRKWLDGPRALEKPDLPEDRGAMTIGDLPAEADPADWSAAVRRWAESTWAAYAGLHPLARRWRAQAEAG